MKKISFEQIRKISVRTLLKVKDVSINIFDNYLYNKPAIVVVCLIIIGVVGLSEFISYIYDPIVPKAKAAISQTIGFNIYDENDQKVTDRIEAKPRETIEWLKQIEISDGDIDSNTISIEKIPDNQDFVPGSMEIPPGWKVQYSTTTVTNPTDNDYNWSDAEPDPQLGQKVTYVRVKTDTVTTLKPTTQSPITKPLDQEPISAPSGMTDPKILTAHRYEDRLFVIYKAIDVSDGTNDANDMTINCLDLTTYGACSEGGVSFPTYMSSQANSKLGGKMPDGITNTPKDISTPATIKSGFDDGTYGHEGYWYIPAQQGNNFGVNCVNIKDLENCGFTSMGSATAPTQSAGTNPTLISGFAQDGSKLYGHANYYDGDVYMNDDFVKVICFDMSTINKCSGFDPATDTSIPSLFMSEHSSSFFTTSQHLFNDNKYYFVMSYDDANPTGTTLNADLFNHSYFNQTSFGNKLICFDVISKTTCSGWPTANPSYKSYEWNIFTGYTYYRQTVYGATITSSNASYSHGVGSGLYERAYQAFFSRDSNGSIRGICVFIGINDAQDAFPIGSIGIACFNSTGVRDDNGIKPPDIVLGSWKSGPWVPNYTSFETDGKLFSSWILLPNMNPFDPDVGRRGAMLCYDWQTQDFCQGYRTPHYWFEINDVDTMDAEYIPDERCMMGVSGLDFVWSFDIETAETPCRKIKKTVQIKPQIDAARAFCDGSTSQRDPSWGYLKLNRANLYDFKEVKVTVKDKNGSALPGFTDIDIKQLPDGRLDISSLPYSGNTDELSVEFNTEIFNTSPWADDYTTIQEDPNFPLATAVMNVDNLLSQEENAQYCYKTKVKDICDIDATLSVSKITNLTEDDELNVDSELNVDISQEPNIQCFKDLKVTVTADKTEVRPGDDLTYTIRVDNQANEDPERRGDINGTYTEVTIPTGTTLVSTTGQPSVDGEKVTWASESIFAKSYSIKTVTLKINQPTTSTGGLFSIPKAYAQSNQLIFRAMAVFDGDYSQADNTVTFSGVILSESTEQNQETEQTSPEQNNNQNGGDGSPSQLERNSTTPRSRGFRNQYTPKGLEKFIPAPLRGAVEKIFRGLHAVVSPLPVSVAMAIPYGIISIVLALAIIKIYQAIDDKKVISKSDKLRQIYGSTRKLRKTCLDLASRIISLIIEENSTGAKQNYQSIVDHSSLFKIGNIDEVTDVSSSRKQKIFSIPSLALIVVIAITTLLFNSIFIWAGKYTLSSTLILIQSSYLILSAGLYVIAYSYQKNTEYLRNIAIEKLNNIKLVNTNESKLTEEVALIISKDASNLEKTDTTDKIGSGKIISSMKKLEDWNKSLDVKSSPSTQTKLNPIANQVILGLQLKAQQKNITLKSTINNELSIDIDKESFEKILKTTTLAIINSLSSGSSVDLFASSNNAKETTISFTISGGSQFSTEINNIVKLTESGRLKPEDLNEKLDPVLDLFEAKILAEKSGGKITLGLSQDQSAKLDIIIPKK